MAKIQEMNDLTRRESYIDTVHQLLPKYENEQAGKRSDSPMKKPTDVAFFHRKRYYVLLLMVLGNILMAICSTSCVVALLELTYDRTVTVGNETITQKAQLQWSMAKKSSLMATGSIGYLLGPVAGIMSIKYGAINVATWALLIMGLQALSSPFLIIHADFYVFFLNKMIGSCAETMILMSHMAAVNDWSLPTETSRFASSLISGYMVGITVSFSLCGFVAQRFGWEAMYYLFGSGPIICAILMFIFVSTSPQEDRFISKDEKLFIGLKRGIGDNKNRTKKWRKYPWKAILTSKPVWAFLNERFVESWCLSFSGLFLSMYIKDVCNTDTIDTSILTSIPNLCAAFTMCVGGYLADFLRPKLGKDKVHKIFLLFAQFSAATLLIIAGLSADFTTSMICFSLCRLLFSIADISYGTLPMDIAGDYNSIITGLSFVMMAFGFTFNPILVTWLINDHTLNEWIMYFLLLSVFNIWGGIIFVIFGSSDLQPWAKFDDNE